MQNILKKMWLPIAAFIAILSLGLILKTATSSEKFKSTNGIVVDNLVTNHLWCTSSTLESACGPCRKGQKPQKPVRQKLLSGLVDTHSLRVERHRIPT